MPGVAQPMVPARSPCETTPLEPLGALLGALHELVVPCAFSWVFNSLALKSAFWSKYVCIGMPAWWICTPEGLGASQNIPRRTPKLGMHKAKLGWQALAPHAKHSPQGTPPCFRVDVCVAKDSMGKTPRRLGGFDLSSELLGPLLKGRWHELLLRSF